MVPTHPESDGLPAHSRSFARWWVELVVYSVNNVTFVTV
jgi:hypothetical protein